MIEVRALEKRYSDGNYALRKVSFRLNKRVSAIIGRNGAGKTTLMRILSTQLEQTSGKAIIDGYDTFKDADKVRRMVVSIPQEASPIGYLTPIEHLKMYLVARGIPLADAARRSEKALKVLEMADAADTPTDMLSGGTKRKVFVAMALASDAEMVFLDEPTTGLDPLSRFEVWSAIKELKGRIILTTHYMEEAAELAEDVIMMEAGKVMQQGTVDELLNRFKGRVRAEVNDPSKSHSFSVGNTYIKYIRIGESEKYVKQGYSIKKITLDDLFINRGVAIES
ncbi:MAG: ABC transporter ATP-binding protein [Candidatus Micrarchaeales archaeon]|jgi:ABC-2 type transport system ATP-binding protein|uniref:ABC transport system ATP-binding protein n=1 Tax=Candidatus Micrarchaeum acidiphilum ARMAN-2 TaxID=425595 RepID=C7DH61_MICA2|nr:MAG: ABC transport system ATP-binding protein [Candidatus Micrarchaeum acidiphilum ARMAN-2]MCW6161381.1 ABC transporter ATP-binding protein [Candidatus Micrarchaeales archaeon]